MRCAELAYEKHYRNKIKWSKLYLIAYPLAFQVLNARVRRHVE